MPLWHNQVMYLERPNFVLLLLHDFLDLSVYQFTIAFYAVSYALLGDLLCHICPLCIVLLGLVLHLLE